MRDDRRRVVLVSRGHVPLRKNLKGKEGPNPERAVTTGEPLQTRRGTILKKNYSQGHPFVAYADGVPERKRKEGATVDRASGGIPEREDKCSAAFGTIEKTLRCRSYRTTFHTIHRLYLQLLCSCTDHIIVLLNNHKAVFTICRAEEKRMAKVAAHLTGRQVEATV